MTGQSRRHFLRSTTRLAGAAILAPSLQGLVACASAANAPRSGGRRATVPRRASRGDGGYGALHRAGPELALPSGFTYEVLSWTGKPMSDGRPTPCAFDGMGAFPLPDGNIRLVRNHENRDTPATARLKGDITKAYDNIGGGGTTSLEVRIAPDGRPELVRDFVSLSGTIVNCAGGPTPWGSWLTCEETTEGMANGWGDEHGYIFEVHASAEEERRAAPLKAMGRFVHEAVAVDPTTGYVYETEDRQIAGFYRFVPVRPTALAAGGRLQMLAIDGQPNYDAADGQRMGTILPVVWVDIADPDPENTSTDTAAVFSQGFTEGGARFSRLEGCWWGDDGVFFHATNGGDARCGQVWHYRPRGEHRGELMLVFESPSREMLDYPDNITVSPRGGIVICEDGGVEHFIRGLTPDGRIFDFAQNLLNDTEFAGACFAPDGRTLFLNIMGAMWDAGPQKGVTVAIRGPWDDGAL